MHINIDLYEDISDLTALIENLYGVKENISNIDDALVIDEAIGVLSELTAEA